MANGRQIGSLVPSQVVVAVSQPALNIAHVFTGFAETTALDIERGEAAWQHTTGTHGFVSRVHNVDETAMVTLHISQTSSDNDILSRLYEYDAKQLSGDGLFSISVLDKSGRTALFSTQAYVSVLPNQSFGTEVGTQDWQIVMPYSDWHVGGNTKAGADVQNILAALGYTLDERWVIN